MSTSRRVRLQSAGQLRRRAPPRQHSRNAETKHQQQQRCARRMPAHTYRHGTSATPHAYNHVHMIAGPHACFLRCQATRLRSPPACGGAEEQLRITRSHTHTHAFSDVPCLMLPLQCPLLESVASLREDGHADLRRWRRGEQLRHEKSACPRRSSDIRLAAASGTRRRPAAARTRACSSIMMTHEKYCGGANAA